MNPRSINCLAGALCACVAMVLAAQQARAQTFRYEPKLKAGSGSPSYASPDPAPRMMLPSEALATVASRPQRGYLYPRNGRGMAQRVRYDARSPRYASGESIPPGEQVAPFAEELPSGAGSYPGEQYQGQQYQGEYAEGEPTEGEYFDGDPMGQDGCGDECCQGCDECDVCGPCYIDLLHGMCACLKQTYLFSSGMWKNVELYTGKQAFKGPTDLGMNGDFGFHGGANWGSPFWHKYGIGYQLGGAIIASDFEGRSGPLQHRRVQYYVTTGFFHRAKNCRGLQGGIVFDYLHDDFYVNMDLMQIRGEIGYVYKGHELGFWFAAHTNSDSKIAPAFLEQQSVTWQANDQYNGYYRYQFCNGTVARSWIGLSSHGDGIFGGEATVPFAKKWGLVTSYNYLLPRNDPSVPNNVKESWNLSIAMVWHPGFKNQCDWLNSYRPLIPVADNGWFMEAVK